MKTPTNNVPVYVFEPETQATEFPVSIVDENGHRSLVHQTISDSDIINTECRDVSLNALLRAGVDPSKMHVNTTANTRIDEIDTALRNLSQVELPEIETNPQNQN